jgi:hypothetical protein
LPFLLAGILSLAKSGDYTQNPDLESMSVMAIYHQLTRIEDNSTAPSQIPTPASDFSSWKNHETIRSDHETLPSKPRSPCNVFLRAVVDNHNRWTRKACLSVECSRFPISGFKYNY